MSIQDIMEDEQQIMDQIGNQNITSIQSHKDTEKISEHESEQASRLSRQEALKSEISLFKDSKESQSNIKTTKLVDKWTRNIASKDTTEAQPPWRGKRSDGEPMPPGVKDINW